MLSNQSLNSLSVTWLRRLTNSYCWVKFVLFVLEVVPGSNKLVVILKLPCIIIILFLPVSTDMINHKGLCAFICKGSHLFLLGIILLAFDNLFCTVGSASKCFWVVIK